MRSEQTDGSRPTYAPRAERLFPWLGAIVGALMFLPTLWYGFVWDDRYSIVGNTSLNSWKTLTKGLWGPLNPSVDMYRPITGSILFFQFQVFRLHPWGYHLTSILLHALACVLVFRVARQLSSTPWAALFASLLFAVHAAHLEAVAWVSAFAEPLAVSAILVGFSAYLHYRQDRQSKWLAVICLSFFFGLLIKETAVVLPLLMLAYEFAVGKISLRFLRLNRFLILAIIGLGLLYGAMRHRVYTKILYNESHLPFSTLFFTWPSLLIAYCKHLLIPTPLSPFYDSDYVQAANPSFWLPLLGLLAIAAAVYLASKRLANGALVRFCLLAMAIAMIPVLDLNIFQFREIMHDRFLYLPSVFFAVLLGELLFGSRVDKSSLQIPGRISAALGACLLLLNLSALLIQSPVWRDNISLHSYAVRIAPHNPRPAFALALMYLDRGDLPKADELLQHVVQLVPAPKAFALLGQTRLRMGDAKDAEAPLRQAIMAAPDRSGQHLTLAQCLVLLGRTDEAKAELRAEMALSPEYREVATQQLSELLAAKP